MLATWGEKQPEMHILEGKNGLVPREDMGWAKRVPWLGFGACAYWPETAWAGAKDVEALELEVGGPFGRSMCASPNCACTATCPGRSAPQVNPGDGSNLATA